MNKDSDGNIEVNDFLYFIDLKKCKAPPVQPVNVYVSKTGVINIIWIIFFLFRFLFFKQNENDKKLFKSSYRRELVDWAAFIAELGLEKELKQETE